MTSTNSLIPVLPGNIAGQSVHLVDARQLHVFLEVKRDFSTWIKGRIGEYGFDESLDYLLTKTGEQLPSGLKWRTDYLLTIDMAKELAMVERNQKGREVRRYFIECERELRQIQQSRTATLTHQPATLSRAERQAINRQAWAEVTGDVQRAFQARRETLVREYASRKGAGACIVQSGFRPDWAR